MPDPENPQGVRYALSSTQYIEVLPLPAGAGVNRLDHAAWNTESAEGMRKYLAAKGWKTPAHVEQGSDGSRWFAVLDPEGNKVQFVRAAARHRQAASMRPTPSAITSSTWVPGARPRCRGQVLPRSARLPALLVGRARRQGGVGEPAVSRRPRLDGVHDDARARHRHSGDDVAEDALA